MTIPNPPNGYVGQPASDLEDAQAKFYGEDIWYDVRSADANAEPDYVIDAAGDVAIATGLEALRQSLLRRLITNPGEWQTLPEFGVGALQYVKALNTPAARAELTGRIRSQFMSDDRVESVSDITFDQLDDATVKISVQVIAKGRLRQDKPLPVTFNLR